MALELSEKQQVTVATAITILSAVVIILAVGTLFWLVGAFFVKFSAIFLPVAVAAVVALVVKPYFEAIRRRLHIGRVPALIVVFLSAIVPIGALGWFFGAIIFDQLKGLVQSLPGWWASAVEWARVNAPQIEHLISDTRLGQALGWVSLSSWASARFPPAPASSPESAHWSAGLSRRSTSRSS
jgi:predicted PurR-regulated permease PerM